MLLFVVNRLNLKEFFVSFYTTFSSKSGLFISTEWRCYIPLTFIYINSTCFHLASNHIRFFFRSIYSPCKSVDTIICNLYSFFYCIIRKNYQYRSEDFFLRNSHISCNITENSRLCYITAIIFRNTANKNSGSFFNTKLNIFLYTIKLFSRRQWSQCCGWIVHRSKFIFCRLTNKNLFCFR